MGRDFALIRFSDKRYLSPLWLSIAQIVKSIPATGATTNQILEKNNLSLNTLRGYLRALIASGFPITIEKQNIKGAPHVYFIDRKQVRWLDPNEGTSPNSPKANAVRLMLANGWSVKDIVVATELSHQRIYKLKKGS